MRSNVRPLALLLVAAGLFALFAWFGRYVTAHGEPAALLVFAKQVRAHAIGLAWAFTNCGWVQVLGPLYLACIFIAVRFPAWRARMVYLIASGLLSWLAADRFQHVFARPRRSDWLLRHEHAFSYPSSHASTSTGFYLLAAVLVLRSDLPPNARYAGFAALTAMWLGICWSRLSLAAHYPTDVAGGVILGAAIALLGAAVVRLAGKNTARA
ncbi:MAG: phosphatase PAP2 family protein [Candidatus Baltobacteraceae bacterium]